jgi:ubiquinone biosynthesis protein
MITLVKRVHATEGGRDSLHSLLPTLGPLASTFMQSLADRVEGIVQGARSEFRAFGQ